MDDGRVSGRVDDELSFEFFAGSEAKIYSSQDRSGVDMDANSLQNDHSTVRSIALT